MIQHRLIVAFTFSLGASGVLILATFLVTNWMNPVAITLNIICVLALIGAGGSIWRILEPMQIPRESKNPALQNFGESVARALGYNHSIVFITDHQLNASASREFGLFGKRIVALGEVLLASRDIEAIKFIIAHEITHLRYRDNFITALSWLSQSWLSSTVETLNPFSKSGPEQTTLATELARFLLFFVFLPVWGWLFLVRKSVSVISHDLEYRADRGGAVLSSPDGIKRAFGLIAYLGYFARENNYELYGDRTARFLSWIPLPESTVSKWIAESTESASHPSVKARLQAAMPIATPFPAGVPVENDFLEFCEGMHTKLAGGRT